MYQVCTCESKIFHNLCPIHDPQPIAVTTSASTYMPGEKHDGEYWVYCACQNCENVRFSNT